MLLLIATIARLAQTALMSACWYYLYLSGTHHTLAMWTGATMLFAASLGLGRMLTAGEK